MTMANLGQGLGWGLGRGLRRLIDATTPAPDDGFRAAREALAEAPARLMAALTAIPREHWRSAPAAGGFPVVEHACHLRDLETEGYRVRLDRILAEDRPSLPDFDGEAVARERGYRAQDAVAACNAFAAVRAGVVARLAALSALDRTRVGLLDGRTPITVDGMVAAMRAHDTDHLEALASLGAEWGARRPG
jgi:hypothetical protein